MPSVPAGGSKIPVVLFKTPAEPLETDSYCRALSEDFDPHFVPVLADEFHTDELSTIIRVPRRWEGVVITSRRGAEAWARAAELEAGAEAGASGARLQDGGNDWSTVPLYTVGAASVDVMSESAKKGATRRRFIPAPAAGGERSAKSAGALVPLLLDALPMSSDRTLDQDDSASEQYVGNSNGPTGSSPHQSYLIIRGDKSLEEIPAALKQAGRDIVELTVYSTSPRSDIAQSLAATLRIIRKNEAPTTPVWLAFFSPSSASYVLPHIPTGLLDQNRLRYFAIGETTRSYLEEQGVTVHAVAGEPNARGLSTAILAAGE